MGVFERLTFVIRNVDFQARSLLHANVDGQAVRSYEVLLWMTNFRVTGTAGANEAVALCDDFQLSFRHRTDDKGSILGDGPPSVPLWTVRIPTNRPGIHDHSTVGDRAWRRGIQLAPEGHSSLQIHHDFIGLA